MLSKRLTFSILSLITIFAFAFVATPAMADAFEIKISGRTSVGYAATNTTTSHGHADG